MQHDLGSIFHHTINRNYDSNGDLKFHNLVKMRCVWGVNKPATVAYNYYKSIKFTHKKYLKNNFQSNEKYLKQ